MPWNDLIPTAGSQQTLNRARGAVGRKTVYHLSGGGMNPLKPLDRLCDCSGFVAWAIGIPRQLPPGSGGWLDTDAYARGGGPAFPGLCAAVQDGDARPGDLLVYPDYLVNGKKREGHIGIITGVDGQGKPTRVVHCSTSNSRAGDAVAETGTTVWKARGDSSRVMRIDYGALRARYAPGHKAAVAPVAAAAAGPLQHPLLGGEAVLQAVTARKSPALHPTSGPVPGMGAVQDALNHLGARYPEYTVKLGANRKFRGYFGPKTEQAVKSFQASHRIKPDGLVGRDTLKALDAALRSFDRNQGVDRTRATPPTSEHVPEADARRAFIQLLAPAAREAAIRTRVPASITLAQGALESNWGRSLLSVNAKNFFGIKGRGPAGSVTMPTVEWVGGKPVKVKAAFRAYHSMEESCVDHAELISRAKWKNGIPIYGDAMKYTGEPRKFAAALEGVYATDPDYAEKLWRLMDEYQLQTHDVP